MLSFEEQLHDRPSPRTTKVWNFERSFRDNAGGHEWVSLPQAFKQAGFLTTGMGKVFHPGQPANHDYPASWSPQWGYFSPEVDTCDGSYTLHGDEYRQGAPNLSTSLL
jgi:hypothetical protein